MHSFDVHEVIGSVIFPAASRGGLPMTDKVKMPADGGGIAKGQPDGVSGSPDAADKGRVHGRSAGGESGGAAYPNPHSGEESSETRFSGGQGEKAYYGGDNPNATAPRGVAAEGESPDEGAGSTARNSHEAQAGGRSIKVIEDSGVAAAEASGKVGTDRPYEREQESPGGG
jgi:hypothetical protein